MPVSSPFAGANRIRFGGLARWPLSPHICEHPSKTVLNLRDRRAGCQSCDGCVTVPEGGRGSVPVGEPLGCVRCRRGELTDMMCWFARPVSSALFILALVWPAAAQDGPQPQLPIEPLRIVTDRGAVLDFQVEMALTSEEQRIGLMFRPAMPLDSGMLFVFPRPRIASFWMRNTLIPLDMLFIAADGTVLSIAERTETQSDRSYRSIAPVRAVLEINGGLSSLLGIAPGDRVEHPAFATAP